MRSFSTFLLLLVLVVFFSSSSYAGGKKNSGVKTIIDNVLQISKTTEPITVDGEMDDVWRSVAAINLTKFEGVPRDTIGSYPDHFATARFLWDDEYFYAFISAVDNELDGSDKASPWLNDCAEIFFDGGNEKASSYDANDIQWRWIYGEVPGGAGNAGNGPGDFVFFNTENGYNLELRIPQTMLTQFQLIADTEIGLEVSAADRDAGARDEVLHWWTDNGNTWADASLFGTAVLSAREVDAVLKIAKTDSEPAINGIMEEGEWNAANEITLDHFEGTPEPLPDTIYADYKDHLTSVWTMWDDNNFYAFARVIDNELDGSDKASPWLNDCVEIFFDGGNEKASSYDANDVQWRWIYGEIPGAAGNAGNGPGDYVFTVTELGYDFELKIPKDMLTAQFALVADQEIGFEVSNGDRDGGVRDDVRHWWTSNGNTWADASLFGTAILATDVVGIEDQDQVITSDYRLEQNYPNPFNPSTQITFSLPQSEKVNLTVYNVLGTEVAQLVNETKSAGTHVVKFNAQSLSSGVYFYRLNAGSISVVRKMMLLK